MKNDLNDRSQYKLGGLGAFLPTEEIRFSHGPTHPQLPFQLPMQPPGQPSTLLGMDTNRPSVPLPPQFSTGQLTPPQPAVPPLATKGHNNPSSFKKKRDRWTRGIIIASVVCLCAVVLSIWIKTRTAADVSLYQVGNQNVTHYIGGGGTVFPLQQLIISYPVSERVVSVFVKPGDQVSPNQALIQLDPSQLNAQITQASNDVAAAQAFLNSVSAGGNPLEIAQAQQAYNFAKNKYNALVAQASSATLHNGKLITPMSGIVTAVNINPGEVLPANKPLITIMDESKVFVRVKVPLINLQQVRLGQSATVTPSALPNDSFPGVVSTIIPQADPQTDTFEVWVQVINTKGILLPGMSAFARIQEMSSGVTVPRLAVLNQDRESIVFVVRNQKAYVQHVHVTGQSGDTIIVGKGLAPGDRVVLVGADRLRDGQDVRIRSM